MTGGVSVINVESYLHNSPKKRSPFKHEERFYRLGLSFHNHLQSDWSESVLKLASAGPRQAVSQPSLVSEPRLV